MRFDNIDSLKKSILYTFDPNDEESVVQLFNSKKLIVPKPYVQFIKLYGAISIVDDVMVKGLSAIPGITVKENYTPIGSFLPWSNSDRSIDKVMEVYKEQFPDNFVPFIEGCSGDFIGFSYYQNGKHSINYWFHEELLHLITHKVAEDFYGFINSIFRYSIPTDNSVIEKITHNPSPKMIELLKKTGKWRGE